MAAGLGFKTFATGEVLSAENVNGYLMQGILVFATEAARDAAITVPAEGQFAFTKDTNSTWFYDGAAWAASGATGDITAVTAGTGISGGGASGDVTVTNSMATAIDAKGDLVPGTGADTFARLAVGANATVLTADSAEATGMKWAAGGAAAPSFSLLSTTTLPTGSPSSVTISGLSGYNTLICLIKTASSTSAAVNLSCRINGDTGANYTSYGIKFGGNTTYAPSIFSQNNNDKTTEIVLGAMSNSAGSQMSGYIRFDAANSTGLKSFQLAVGSDSNGSTDNSSRASGGLINNASVISSFTLFLGGGTFDIGTLLIYGSVA
jgi:hypothetical protein